MANVLAEHEGNAGFEINSSSKFATRKFSLLPGQTVGSKKLLPGKVPRTLSTLSVVNVFSAN